MDDRVGMFLGDIGRDLPESERQYWRGFNVPPTRSLSESTIRRSFLNQWAAAQSADLQFKSAYRAFQQSWRTAFDWDLLRPLHDSDRHLLLGLRIPLNESQPEFEGQLTILARVMVDSLNESALLDSLGSRIDGERGIDKLERWLSQENYPHTTRDIALLRKVQRLRSRIAAHRHGSDYSDFLSQEVGDAGPAESIRDILTQLISMFDDLTEHFTPVEDETDGDRGQ